MVNQRQAIANLADLEQYNHILTQFLKTRRSLYTELSSINAKPEPPAKPENTQLLEFPVYDEKKYYELTKYKLDGLKNAIHVLIYITLCLIITLFGILLIPFTLLALLIVASCIPSRKRKVARAAYFEECEQVEQHNRQAIAAVEKYQRKCVEYENSMRLYEQRLQDYQYQEKMLTQYITVAEKTKISIESGLNAYYKSSPLLQNRGNYISVVTINSYLKDNSYATLNNAIQYFDDMKYSGKIAPDIEYALLNRAIVKEHMASVLQALDKGQEQSIALHKDLLEYVIKLSPKENPTSCSPALIRLCDDATKLLSNLTTYSAEYL